MKPILFNTEMVRAILDGRKGATRRVADINPDIPCTNGEHEFVWDNFTGGKATGFVCRKCGFGVSPPHSRFPVGASFIRPRYFPGDILYVRETWRPFSAWNGSYNGCEIEYKAGGIEKFDRIIAIPERSGRWHPSIHMPKEAARLFLRVTNVRVERLQGITEDQAKLEGFPNAFAFSALWNSTIPKDKLPVNDWNANPWVWAYGFEQISKEEAQKGGEGK